MPGLLDPSGNLDMTAIQGLLSQFKPSAADQAEAKRQAILMMGLGLLGARRGQEGEALSRAGMLGLTTREQMLRNAQEQQQHGIQSAAQLMQLQSAAQQMADAQKARQIMAGMPLLGGPQQAPGPPQPFPLPGGGSASSAMNAGIGSLGATPQFSPSNVGTIPSQPTNAPPSYEMLQTQRPQQPTTGITKKQVSDYYAALAMQFSRSGLPAQAKDALEMAVKNQPEVQQSKIVTDPATNKRMEMVLFKDGSTQILPYGPDLEKAHFGSTGARVEIPMDPFTGQPTGPGLPAEMTQEQRQRLGMEGANLTLARQRFDWEKQQADKPILQDTEHGLVVVNPRAATAQPVIGPSGPIGPKATEKPMQSWEYSGSVFGQSMSDANAVLDSLKQKGFDGSSSEQRIQIKLAMNGLPASPEAQQYVQGMRQWAEAVTRFQSARAGGTYSPQAREELLRTYSPGAFENKTTVEQKETARKNMEASIMSALKEEAKIRQGGRGQSSPIAPSGAPSPQAIVDELRRRGVVK